MSLRIVDELKETTSSAVRQASLISAMAFALLIAVAFLIAALFVFLQQNCGSVIACLVVAGIFVLLAIVAGIVYAVRKRQIEARARQRAKRAARLLADPAVVATGLQVVRAIGIKRLIPLLAIGGVALGFLATRGSAAKEDEADAPAE